MYDQANRIIENNKDVLTHYVLGASIINSMQEEIQNAQIMAIMKHQCIYTDLDKEPDFIEVNDLWLGGA